ncbi:MAG: TlpA disulfide reductase family protein [Pirellulaceae bacterium]|nr:TlpA disulfide reductase family protein [Pirellulaceae bacterium]
MRIAIHALLLSSLLSFSSFVSLADIKPETEIAEFRFTDEQGLPIPGVQILSIETEQPNGERIVVRAGDKKNPGWSFSTSDAKGVIRLEEIPLRATVLLNVFHPDFLPPSQIKMIGGNAPVTFELRRGDTTLKLVLYDLKGKQLTNDDIPLEIYLRSKPINFSLHRVWTTKGEFSFRILNAQYDNFRISSDEFVLTPQLGGVPGDEALLDFSDGDSRTLVILARPKLKATGRVIRETGMIPENTKVSNDVENLSIFPETGDVRVVSTNKRWFLKESEVDLNGDYEMDVVEGVNQVYLSAADGFYTVPFEQTLEVTHDSQNRIGDYELRPIPSLIGKVVDEARNPLRSMIVRTQTEYWFDHVVTQTDQFGRFEIEVRFLPFDHVSHQLRTNLKLLAFDPSGLRAGTIEIDIFKQNARSFENLEIKTSEHSIEWVSKQTRMSDSTMARFAKAIEPSREKFSQSVGQSIPNLANGSWLNTSAKSLDDFRGKYVLLDFWFIGCGPCASELPNLKLLQTVYGDRPFTIVSVHTGRSETVENVGTFAVEHSMSYPIVVDGPEFEIQKEFEPFGLAGFPSYILIGPDGKVVFTDAFFGGLSLRNNKFEILREHLWQTRVLR